ncbi:MAG: hypothetical protein MJY69_07410 [Bacteroidales bacterium]|nr:hypothetical protein [Bacteroidales bacterium]
MRSVRRICSMLIGFVFFIAGILKLMDPTGAGLIISEYFKFLHLGFLSFSSYFTAAAFSLMETITGIALITGIWRRLTAIVSGIMLGFFTLLTLVLLVCNPQMECGCFGEAIHLTHSQSFIKNIILCVLWAVAFIPIRKVENRKIKYVSFSLASISCILFLLYSIYYIPLIDFTPFAPGEELAQLDEEFQEDAPVLSFSDKCGVYADSLAVEGKVFVSSVYNPAGASSRHWARIAQSFRTAEKEGYRPILLIASTPDDVGIGIPDPILLDNAYFADRRTLMTLNRSNGGFTTISDGCIIRKWSVNAGISDEDIYKDQDNSQFLKLEGFLLYVFSVMLLL